MIEHAALVDDPDGVRHLLDFAQQVAGHNDRQPVSPGQALDEFANLVDARGVESVGRLVQDQQFRAAEQRHRDPEPLLHPERILLRELLRCLRQTNRLQRRVDGGGRCALDPTHDVQVLPPGQMPVERGRLDQRPDARQDALRGTLRERLAEHLHPSRGGGDQAQEHLHRRGLAGAVRAEKPEHLSGTDREAHILDHGHTPIPLR
ncbi:hypothetical protein SDC9_159753 [bioreactor metagenome]|uniref:Uncharacterized protein n=1 Tax=bioreactor metagenome TaxID=1076179 RepID=A0A645FDF6_9ZZZZ